MAKIYIIKLICNKFPITINTSTTSWYKIPNKVYTLNRTLAHLKYNNNYHLNV